MAAKCLAARAAQRCDGGGRSPAPQRAWRCRARVVLSPTGTHDGHRGRGAEPNYTPTSQNPPLPGERPGVLKEPGSQGVAASSHYVAAEVPLVGTPRLQGNDALGPAYC